MESEVVRYGLDVLAMQEVRWPGVGESELRHGTILYSGRRDNSHREGVGVYMSKKARTSLVDFAGVSERILRIRVDTQWCKTSIVVVYAPTEVADVDEKDDFYSQLSEVLDRIPTHDVLIVMGDFNAQVGREVRAFQGAIGKHSLHQTSNDNGIRLATMALEKGLVVGGTLFQHKDIHKATWVSPDGQTRNQIDHILIGKKFRRSLCDVRARRGAECNSDHFLVQARIQLKLKTKRSAIDRVQKVNLEALKSPSRVTDFNIELRNRFEVLAESEVDRDMNAEWKAVNAAILEAATATFGLQRKKKRGDWFDDECREAAESSRHRRERWLDRGDQESEQQMREARRSLKRIIRRKKRESLRRKVELIDEYKNTNKVKEQFRTIKDVRQGYQPRQTLIRDDTGNFLTNKEEVMGRWMQYFERLLNRPPPNEAAVEEFVDPATEEVTEPSTAEVKKSLRRMRKNKAPGADGVQAELWQVAEEGEQDWLAEMILRVWREERMPEDWNLGMIVPVHKKEDRANCSNYRGISLLSMGYKLFAKILEKRMKPFYREAIGSYQAGFVEGRSTTDQLFIIRQYLEKFWEYNKESWHLFVDFKQAYDSIDRPTLWKIMASLGVPEKLIRLARMCYEGTRCCVRVGGQRSPPFQVTTGLRQGCPLAPILFNFALEWVMRQVDHSGGLRLEDLSCDRLAYADDVDLMADDFAGVERKLVDLRTAASKVGMAINEDKTKLMKIHKNHEFVCERVACGGLQLEAVSEFKYLGSIVTNRNDMEVEISARVAAGTRCIYALKRIFTRRWLSRAAKVEIYTKVIRPIVLYGCETWTLTQRLEKRLEVFENGVLRRICGPVYDQEEREWRRRHNQELREITGVPLIQSLVKSHRLRWAGHIARRENNEIIKEVLKKKPQGRRPVGRPRKRWSDCVREDTVRLLRRSDWENIAQDRPGWRSVVAAARGLHGLRPPE